MNQLICIISILPFSKFQFLQQEGIYQENEDFCQSRDTEKVL